MILYLSEKTGMDIPAAVKQNDYRSRQNRINLFAFLPDLFKLTKYMHI